MGNYSTNALYIDSKTMFSGEIYGQGAVIGILMLVSVAILVVPCLIQNLRTETELRASTYLRRFPRPYSLSTNIKIMKG